MYFEALAIVTKNAINQRTKWICLGVVGFVLATGLSAVAAPRTVQNMDAHWRFHLGDLRGGQSSAFDDSAWRELDVPHDWSIEGDYDANNPTGVSCGYLPSGIGWYRRVMDMPDSWRGQTVTLAFEGVYMNSAVWLNGVRVGGRPYGYSSFTCDLTPHIKPGRNVLAVRVDNSLEPSARWYHGCGIYGHVRLLVNHPIHVPVNGIFVTTPSITGKAAVVHVAAEVANAGLTQSAVEVRFDVVGPDGKRVAGATKKATLPAGETVKVQQDIGVKAPALWSIETPNLYTLRTRVVRDGEAVDEIATPFGIRSIRFDAKRGFFLNGQRVKLKGICDHQGGSPVGAAMPEELMARRLRQLKQMGCNAIRTAHNPQLPAFYDLCDRMGFLVMDEIFDGWHRKAKQGYGARFFKSWWQRDVSDWVRRDRNHPCVILWSIGNETGKEDVNGITKLIHTIDESRPTTGGSVIEGVDVAGFNGGIVRKDSVMEDYHRKYPDRPVVMTEEPHTFQTRGFYRTVNHIWASMDDLPDYAEPEVFHGGPEAYRSSYDNCGRRLVARNCWKRTVSRPWVCGEFRWTAFDYLGEAWWSGEQRLAREFNFGVIDLAGLPKDEYYFYQSIWTTRPMVHLLPHWTHPGLEGTKIPVVAYANADSVELFQDGKSLGRKPRSDLLECVWHVPYRPGELKAVAYRAGKAVAETTVRTADEATQLQLTTDNASLKADRDDLALVTMAVRDGQGTLAPHADDRIDLALIGPARYLGAENGDPVDITPQRKPWRRVFAGLARAFYAGQDGRTGPVEVAGLGILGRRQFLGTGTARVVFDQVALRGPVPAQPVEIRYTTDGSTPTVKSAVYDGPIVLKETTAVRAAAFRDGRTIVSSVAKFTQSR